jgi:transcriptional regulator of acetoin/glycerol metabolism
MSDWQTFIDLVAAEAGPEAAGRIQERARVALGGLRLTIPKRAAITDEMLRAELRRAGGRVDQAAKRLRISRATLYRRLVR